MSAELIYKTTSPAAIEWWQNATAEARKQSILRQEFADEMLAEFGPSTKAVYGDDKPDRKLWVRGESVIGLDSNYNEKPPADSGWRLDSKDRIWKPALKTAKGRALRDRLAALTTYSVRAHSNEIGVPEIVFAGMHMYRPGLSFDEEPTPTLFQVWGSGQCATECEKEQAKLADIEWVEVKRSVWYARVEAKADES
jgi:hypothetical protein